MLEVNRRRRRGRLRFVRSYVILGRPFSEVESELVANTRHWLPSLGESARVATSRLLTELGYDGSLLATRVESKLGRPQRTKQMTCMQLEFQPDAGDGLRPVVVGQLEIAPIGPSTTHVGISGIVAVPHRLDREIADEATLHRVAEAAISKLLEQLTARLATDHTR